jgi:hypothetical protein
MITTVLLCLLVLQLGYIGSHRLLSRLQRIVVVLLFIAGATLVVLPSLANRVANALNVGRGADLLLYFAVLAAVYAAAHFYFRLKQMEQTIVEIVRQLALLTPQGPQESKIQAGVMTPEA